MGLLGGVACERLHPEWQVWVAVVSLPIFVLGLRLRLGLIALLTLLTGMWRAQATDFSATPLGHEIGHTVTVDGTIADDPGINDKNQVAFVLGDVHLNGYSTGQRLRVLTTYKVLQRGFQVQATGKLKEGIGAVPAQMSFAPVTVISSQTDWLERLRQRLFTATRSALPDPLSGFGLGLLIGVRALISKQLQATLNAVGLSHLIAVSGYNLTIIIQAVRRISGGVSHFVSTALSLWLIAIFLLITGFGASIVRAALVSLVGLLVAYFGYEAAPLTLISVPALLTVAWNPDYLLRDAGWQLSFLAFAGILVLAPLLQQRFVHHPNTIKLLVIEALAAQATTTPIIMGLFGNLSMVAPLANAVILPLVPLAMLLSFATGIISVITPVAGAWVSEPTAGLLGLMIGIIQWFATWPYANLQLKAAPWQVAALYAGLIILTLALWRTTRRKHNLSG